MIKNIMMMIKNIFRYNIFTKDPLKHCEVQKNEGCCHCDGYLCNVDTCNIRKIKKGK